MVLSSTINGCHFQFRQSFNTKNGELKLKNIYEINPDLALSVKKMPAPCFDLVVDKISSVLDELSLNQAISEKTDHLATYFQGTYIRGEKNCKNERIAMFSIEVGNHCEQTSAGFVRTINSVEG